jgi:FXSXX-COOH protein
MATTLAVKPAVHHEPADRQPVRPRLDELARLGSETITAGLHRALPGAESGQVPVAAFNSSI